MLALELAAGRGAAFDAVDWRGLPLSGGLVAGLGTAGGASRAIGGQGGRRC